MQDNVAGRTGPLEAAREAAPAHATAVVLEAVLDHFTIGTIVVDEHANVVHMNEAATRLVTLRDGIEIAGRAVSVADADSERSLRDAIARAARSPRSRRSCAGMVTIDRPSGRPPFHACVAPLGARSNCIALFLFDQERRTPVSLEVMTVAFRLSPAEARIASKLAGGATALEVADELGLSVHTVRTHVKAILLKTGSRSQRELGTRLAPFAALRFDA